MTEAKKIDFTSYQTTHITTIDKGSLRQLLGTRDLFSVGYGDVGSSIYYALGLTCAFALGATPIAITVAGLFFLFTTLTYMELSAAMPVAGGAQVFARRAFNSDLLGFIAGWALLLDYVITAAISAFTIGPYLGYFFPYLKTDPSTNIAFTSGIITFLTLLNVIGIKKSTGLSFALASFDIITRVVIIGVGFITVFSLPKIIEQIHFGTSPTWTNFIYGVSIAMVAYTGIEATSQLTGECKEPGRNVPQAMRLTMITVTIMYISISLIALSAISAKELGTTWKSDPIAGIAMNIPYIGNYITPWIAILGAVILFIATNAGIVGASRMAYSMASNYQLTRHFSTLHPRFKTPYTSLIFFSGIAILIVLIGRKLDILADLYNFGAMLAFSIAHLSLIGLRIREPELQRPYKLKGNIRIGRYDIPITAILGFIATFSVWIVVIAIHPYGRYIGFGWMAFGTGIYLFYRKKTKLPAVKAVEIEKIKGLEFKEIRFKHILVPTRGGKDTDTVQIAAKLAKTFGAELCVLYVIEIPTSLPLDDIWPDKIHFGNQILNRASAISREIGIAATTRLLQARSAAQTIVEVAKDENFDLIVIGNKMPSPFAIPRTTLLGFNIKVGKLSKTVEYIVQNAPCKVWICTF